MVISKSLIDGQKSRHAKRTEKEILMAAKRLPTFGAAALDADTAASVQNPGSQQGAAGAWLPSHSYTGERDRIFLDCGVRSSQDSTFPRPRKLLPGAKRQLGQQNKGASIPEGAAGQQENYSSLPPWACSLCFVSG